MEFTLTETGIKSILIENAMHWRYAAKVFDKHKKLPPEKFDVLVETLRLAPSSLGLQPWKFVVVNKKNIRSELKKASMQQEQLTDASHLLVLCSLKNMNAAYVDELIEFEKQENGHSYLENYKPLVMSFIESMKKEELKAWMAEQVYIALGFLLSACAMLHIDACPIGAFDKNKFNKILGLNKHGIESRVAVAIGYRGNDAHARDKKIRWPKEKLLIII